jgi:hypothetical protein
VRDSAEVFDSALVKEVIETSLGMRAKDGVEVRTTQVAIDKNDAPTLLPDFDGEIRGEARLPHAAFSPADRNDLRRNFRNKSLATQMQWNGPPKHDARRTEISSRRRMEYHTIGGPVNEKSGPYF